MLPAAEPAGAVGAGTDPVPGFPGTTVPIRPLSFRELLDLPFALIQANIRALAGVSLAGLLAAEAVIVAVTAGVSGLTDGSDAGTAWAAILSTAAGAWLLRFVLRGTTVALGLATVGGAPIGWRTALGRCGAVFGPLLVFQLLFTLVGVGVIAVGSLLIVTLPLALIWLGWLRARRWVALPVLFVERTSHRDGVARAKLLAEGAEWQTTGLWMAQRALGGLLAIPLLGIPLFITDFSGTHRWPVIVLTTAAVLLVTAFSELVEASSRVVCYLDRRCRREGLDIRIPIREAR
ncbi:hypothetical protein OHA40_15935 [Nocardia sp. NBC_00508]|uniref:hypothetical protein n=1 Tax=Nocardia sp. NBC_00508 TaxID=2975992 RepID=UPI002E81879E|nr:hypothetical protein [Nocardia sp. NBC_00508]WUD69476.1 hypothetical protein OHA40_15935 [Nocardia sp. NBC_00508]